MLTYPTHERISGLAQPLLVIRGGNDPIADQRWATWLSAQPSRGRTATVNSHRHNVLHSAPAHTAQTMIDFANDIYHDTFNQDEICSIEECVS